MDSDGFHRREALGLIGLSLVILPLNGCIFALMRILVGRGLAGTLVRAGRLGRTASALTFGRGIAVGSHLVPARASALPASQILGPGRQVIARSQSSASESRVYMGNSAVFHSQRTPYGFRHFDFEGPVGRSSTQGTDDLIRHQSEDGVVTAVDRIRRTARLVEHFSAEGGKVGETRFEQRGDELDVLADNEAVESIFAARNALGLQCPEAQTAFNDWQRAKDRCGAGDARSCREVSSRSAQYQHLRDACVR